MRHAVPKLKNIDVDNVTQHYYQLADGDVTRIEKIKDCTQENLLKFLLIKETQKLNEMIDILTTLEKQETPRG